jgi:hypothetical protein
MKEGNPEWMRANYAEMTVAHLSIFGNGMADQNLAASDQSEKGSTEERSEKGGNHAS